MPYKITRKKSQCKGCPLDGAVHNKCYGVSDTEKPEIAIIGEAPGADEDLEGIPFVGYSGKFLKRAVDSTGHMWHKAHKTNVILCRPPSNNFSSPEAEEAIPRCRDGLIEELKELKKRGVWIILAVGASPMKALNITGSIMKMRGSVYMLKFDEELGIVPTEKVPYDFICIPTFHPSFLLRGNLHHEVTFVNDIEKAYSFLGTKYQPPKEHFNIFPTIQEIEAYTDEICKKKKLIAVDCETTSLVPGKGRIIVVGIGTSETTGFSIPFSKQGGKDYWNSPSERMRAHECLKRMMAEVPTMFQNSMFDMRYLYHFGTPVYNLHEDTMLLNHAISPELPHKIGYIVSIYGKTPYWKDEVLSAADRMINMDDEIVRTYNLRDCVVLHQVIGPMLKEAKENKTLHIYRDISLKLIDPVMKMTELGLLIDKKALSKWKASLKGKLKRAELTTKMIADLPEQFNLNSGDHMRFLLFGMHPAQEEKARTAYEEALNNPRKSQVSKEFKKNKGLVELFDSVKPFKRLKHELKKTEAGSISVDEDALLSIHIAASNRLFNISSLRKKTEAITEEENEIRKILSFLKSFRKYAEIEKLSSTYSDFPTNKNGRVNFPYKIIGTTTGRLSSGNKKAGEPGNAQNIPPEARHLFIEEPGYIIVEFDHKNFELRIIAELSDDNVLRNTFKSGRDAHDDNCILFFGIDPTDKTWKKKRKVCKTYIFLRNYGGGLVGAYRKIMKENPDLELTYAQFCEMDKKYRDAHPAYTKWREEIISKVTNERCLKNAFGRIRYFLGSPEDIIREGLDFGPQSTGADIVNMETIRICEKAETEWNNDTNLLIQAHDALIFRIKEGKNLNKRIKAIKSIMEEPVQIGKNMVSFPVECKAGYNWGELKPLEL